MAESNILDPRHRNNWFDTSSPATYLAGYNKELYRAMNTIDPFQLGQACEVIEKASQAGKHIYAIGNGGSAAIADHLCCDWTKGTHVSGKPSVMTHSLSANGALLLAAANDFGFANCFSKQVEFYVKPGDVLIAISSSGNSENILNAVELAKKLGGHTIGLSGFTGGALKDKAEIPIYIDASNYGIVEDCHQSVMHVIAQYLVSKRENR